MSTTETRPTTTEQLPGNDVQVQGGSSAWRFAGGKMVRGQEIKRTVDLGNGQTKDVETGDYPEERQYLNGRLRRVWIYKGYGKFGAIHQIEADIENVDGMFRLKANLLDSNGNLKPSISACNFAWCLLQFGKDEDLRLETKKGEPVTLPNGSKGGCPTYVNCFRIEGRNAMPIYRPRRSKDAPKQTMLDQWAELEPQIMAHPAWKERDVTQDHDEDASEVQYRTLVKECTERGWPTPEQAPVEWLDLARRVLKKGAPIQAVAHIEEDEWGMLRAGLSEWLKKTNGQTPPLIQIAKDRIAKELAAHAATDDAFGAQLGANADAFGSGADGYDPFADQ